MDSDAILLWMKIPLSFRGRVTNCVLVPTLDNLRNFLFVGLSPDLKTILDFDSELCHMQSLRLDHDCFQLPQEFARHRN